MPGAVSISLEQQGELSYFYADGVKYYTGSSNSGYQGDLETALIDDEFRKTISKEVADKNKVLFENSDVEIQEFALGFQIDGDKIPTLFWFYNCVATRPNVESKTNEDKKEPSTDKINISASPGKDGTIRAKTTEESYDAVKSNWFKKVYEKDETTNQAQVTGGKAVNG